MAQIVSGIAMMLIFGAVSLVYSKKDFENYAWAGVVFFGSGFSSAAYSIVNILSLGIIGFLAEGTFRKQADFFRHDWFLTEVV